METTQSHLFSGYSYSSIPQTQYSIRFSAFRLLASSIIFRLRSSPSTFTAPCSAAKRQCQPYPHPKSRTVFPASGGNSGFSLRHSPAALNPSLLRGIFAYSSKNLSLSYSLFIYNHAPVLPGLVFWNVKPFLNGRPFFERPPIALASPRQKEGGEKQPA